MPNSLSNFLPDIGSPETFAKSFSEPSSESCPEPYLTLPPQILAQVFPFHFAFNSDRIIMQCGEVLQRIMPDIIGSHLNQYFRIKRPIIDVDFSDLNKQSRNIFIIESLHNGLFLKGQMTSITDQDIIFFLGSPVVTEVSHLNKMGIKIKDFAIHDAVADFLFLLQTKNKLRDELTEQQVKLKDALREKEAIVLLAEERARTIEKTLDKLKKTQSQLIQSEKMSALGQLMMGISSEINNPVSFINANLNHVDIYVENLIELINLYQQEFPQSSSKIIDRKLEIDLEFLLDDLPNLLSAMKTGGSHIRDILQSLRNFSRLHESEQKTVDLHEGIESTLLILSHKFHQNIQVIKKYGDLPRILCYPSQLNQVFMNILSNAADVLFETDRESKQIVIQTRMDSSNCVCISIQDNGYGIAPEIKKRIFDPFFTTKNRSKGTGFGLSISYQIIEKHRGTIEVISEVGQGTTFVVTIPIY